MLFKRPRYPKLDLWQAANSLHPLTFIFGPLQRFFTNVFNGCYAILMFIVVIFFLIYGVEVYFKVWMFFCFLGDVNVIMAHSCLLSFPTPYFFLQQVHGGFLNDRDSGIPLGIMSFKIASSSSSPACVSPFVSTSSSSHADHDNDKDVEEEKEVTVHLMKEEAGHIFFCLA